MRRGVGDTGPLPGGKGRIRSSIGIGGALKPVLTTLGTPLIGLGFEGLMAKERLENDESLSDILMDPLRTMRHHLLLWNLYLEVQEWLEERRQV